MRILEDGIEIKRNVIEQPVLEAIKNDVNQSNPTSANHGIRGADRKFPSIKCLSQSQLLTDLAFSILGSTPHIVRVIYFDKTPQKNWLVTWHQDKTISVSEKKDIQNWGPWSIKDGTHHVQPPVEVLDSMITFRLHLDDADQNNGCLKVIPKSHKLGILTQSQITEITQENPPHLCQVKAGDLVMMKPHILHSSSKSVNPAHRRVVHIEYSNYPLPKPLHWV